MTELLARPAPLLDIRHLDIYFGEGTAARPAVHGLDLQIHRGEALALIGESGSGKSTTALAILRLLAPDGVATGQILFEEQDLLKAAPRALRQVRGNRIGMIFQEPMNSLNPVHRIGDQIIEAIRAHRPISRAAAHARMLELLDRVRLPEPRLTADSYPHRLSGGQRQRAMIAMAIACEPALLIADEPTTALDATIQADILELLHGLRRDFSMALLLITHDLPIVARWTDRVVVLHHGEQMETLASASLFTKAQHPYTKGLIGASLRLDSDLHHSRQFLPEIRVGEKDGTYSFDLTTFARPERAVAEAKPASTLLDVKNLIVDYPSGRGTYRAVDGVSFTVEAGATLGIVGESGSGKSTLSKAIARLIPTHGGQILFRRQDITHITRQPLRALRHDIQMVFQDPYNSLNPRHTIGDVLEDVLVVQGWRDATLRRRRVAEMLDQVGLPRTAWTRFAHEFSGGQRQRIAIARALILKPSLVICDEPVSALDTSVQAQVLNLLTELKRELGLTYLFVSHDLAVIQYISDRVIVMQKGKVVEENDRLSIWQAPQRAYTRQLIHAARDGAPAALALAS
jgi:peptide/nickel transport system ATP-binding protein